MRIPFWTVTLAVILSCSGPQVLRADVWDIGSDNDNDSGSDNELVHGMDQVHDMLTQQGGTIEDVDWYPLRTPCNASYEIALDGLSGDLSNGTTASPALELLASDASTVVANSVPISSLGVARRLTSDCQSGSGAPTEVVQYVRVSQPACHLNCGTDTQYRIRMRETTALIPRFNNSATQVSILVLQNPTDAVVHASVLAYDSTAALIGTLTVALSPNQVATINLATAVGGALAGKSGALKILNDAPYGALAGKAVAVEPATGFTFDTALSYKAY
jgi:hypothetical protein